MCDCDCENNVLLIGCVLWGVCVMCDGFGGDDVGGVFCLCGVNVCVWCVCGCG